ncbi:MAG: TonB-dependent receptor, partial [Pseudomonadota bacterium]
MKTSKLVCVLVLLPCLISGTNATGQSADPLVEIDIPAQSLGAAIRAFIAETGLQVSVETALIDGRRSQAISGPSTPRDALGRMLAGSGLVIDRVATNVFVLRASTPITANEDGVLELNEIVVSESFLGQVPGATGSGAPFDVFEEARTIETIGGEEIERAGLGDIADAIDTAANVVVTNQFNPTTFEVTVRGISDVGNVNSTAPTVGLFVDGVLLNQSGGVAGTNPGLVDTERVDVFLGAQTTTFGRATTAGAVNVVTKKPTNDLEFSAEGDIGLFTDDVAATGSATFVANAPILENGLLSGRLVGFVNASGGFIEVFGADPAERIESEGFGTRLSLRSQPSENLTLDLQVDYSRVEFDAISQVSLELLEEGEFVTFTDSLGEDRNDSVLVRFASLYDTDFGTFSSNSAFRFSETFSSFDVDGLLAFDLSVGTVTTATTSFSQDFRFDGLPMELAALPGEFVFDAGVSFNVNNFFSQNTADLEPIGGPGFGFLITDDEQDLLNVSAFADAAWRPIPDLELSAGLRYAFDRVKESDETLTTGPAVELGLLPGGFSETGDASFHSLSPRAAVSYDWSDDLTTFFSFATGFRPGGISETEFSGVFEFDEEVTRTFEVGVRSRFLVNRLAINASAFFTKINDFQTPIFVTFPGSILPPQII